MFLEHLEKRFPFKLECVQTDNGQEVTKRLGNTENSTPTLFEARLKRCGCWIFRITQSFCELLTIIRLNTLYLKRETLLQVF